MGVHETNDDEQSILQSIRSVPLQSKSVHSLAHTGNLKTRCKRQGPAATARVDMDDEAKLRTMLFFFIMENLYFHSDGVTVDDCVCVSLVNFTILLLIL
jgi:hypothetical protein